MKQYEAVIKVMEKNGGYATLGKIYQEVFTIPDVTWRTKTPKANIRRIVQEHNDKFFKIKPGLWALVSWKKHLPDELTLCKSPTAKDEEKKLLFDHSYYQGLLVELGNLKKFETFVPAQDKNRAFLGDQKLKDLASLSTIYYFTYPNILKRVKTIDVVWFNERRMPDSIFEVEHSTDIKNSLIKFVELQDFRTEMFIVADGIRKRKYMEILELNAFVPIKKHVRFMSYEDVSEYHTNISKLIALESNIRKMQE